MLTGRTSDSTTHRVTEMDRMKFILALTCLVAGLARAADDPAALRRFADERFTAGDWFRAATEYLRAASYDPSAPDHDELLFKAARCAYRAERYAESRRDLIALAGMTSSTELADRCRFVAAAASFRLKEFDTARELAADTRERSPGSALRDRLAYLQGWSALHAGHWNAAQGAFSSVTDPSPLAPSARDLAALSERGMKRTSRSPWLTGTLSALVPGLGQAVSGYPWDGLSAMLLVGGGAALVSAGLDRDKDAYTTAGIVVLFAFYPANIWGGANAATRADRQHRRRLLDDADRLSTLSLE